MTVHHKPQIPPHRLARETGHARLDYFALVDLACVVLILVLVKQLVLPFNFLLAGPASTLVAMIIASWLLKLRGLSWAELGLRMPEKPLKTVGLSVLVVVSIILASNLADWLSTPFLADVGTSGRFDHVLGNLPAYLFMLLLVWTHSAIFEELLFRAFVISRASAFFGGTMKSDILAALISAIFFGYRHYYYQGLKGAVITGTIGLALALLYLWFGRKNIWPLILGHGIINTLGQTLRFLGIKDD